MSPVSISLQWFSASAVAGDVSTDPLFYRYDICHTGGFKAHIWLGYHINLVFCGVSHQKSWSVCHSVMMLILVT